MSGHMHRKAVIQSAPRFVFCAQKRHGLYTACTRRLHGLYKACTWRVHLVYKGGLQDAPIGHGRKTKLFVS
jgi:hypothetical protein